MAELDPYTVAQAYATMLRSDAGKIVLDDLVKFAQSHGSVDQECQLARCYGRSDVILRMLAMREVSLNKPKPEEPEDVNAG